MLLGEESEADEERFLREARSIAQLSHPNIINIFDFDDHEGRFFLVMEWLEGESVNNLLRRTLGERVETELAWKVIEGAAAGVQHAHQKNVVHADINPSNIFITQDGEIKLLDFGVARYTRNPDLPEDDRFTWVTKPYASPEVLSGLDPVFEDDVFSLGCVAYRVLGGKHPFSGTLSIVAKHQKTMLEPIPELAGNEWQVLQRTLAYDRAERPQSVTELVAPRASDAGQDAAGEREARRFASPPWKSLAAAAAIIVVAGGTWLLQRGTDAETVQPAASSATDAQAMSVPAALVAAATQALEEGQLVAPDERNARTLFREALSLEPGNAEALRGLRTISNDFVQRAQLALTADDPLQAYAALAIAAETDPANPAIEIVEQLLAASANGEMADARLAVATGNLDLAAQRLERAEQYTSIDPAEILAVRQQIAQGRRNDQLVTSLSVADAYINEGRLLSPEGDNAHALLLDLYGQHGDDARLLASMERLAERLLTRAAFAAAAGRTADASELLDAVTALGLLAPEVEAARMALGTMDTGNEQDATQLSPIAAAVTDVEPAEAEELPAPQIAEQSADAAPELSDAPAPGVAEEGGDVPFVVEETPASQIVEEQADEALLAAAAGEQVIADEPVLDSAATSQEQQLQAAVTSEEADSQAAVASQEPQLQTTAASEEADARRLSLQELGITEYVAPRFPGYAERRGVSGTVEIGFIINVDGSTDAIRIVDSQPGRIFDKSAREAVRQWRFEPRDAALNAQVTLRFDYAP